MKKVVFYLFFILCGFYAYSQTNELINYTPKEFINGTVLTSSIIDYRGNNYDVCTQAYDPYVLGVYFNENPDWDPKNPSRIYKIPIKISGISYVRYNENNGIIKLGDPVTSSDAEGVAMKATESGMILGVALEDAGESGDLLKIRLSIQYMR